MGLPDAEEDLLVGVVALVPIPVISHAMELIQGINRGVQQVRQNKHSILRLVDRANRILGTVNAFAKRERDKMENGGVGVVITEIPLPEHIKQHIQALIGVLQQADDFVKKQSSKKFMQHFVNRQSTSAKIQMLHQELASIAQDLSLSLEVDSRGWTEEDKLDRDSDAQDLEFTLQHLVDNDYKILNALELKQQEYLEAMEALQKNLAEHVDRSIENNLERLFMERALASLRRASNQPQVQQIQDWVITSWEIEIGDPISRGGFGEVARATWLGHTAVAVKRLLIRLETNKLREDFMREVKTWYPLRHPHVLPLLGACATAERPFMVSPFMENGHAIQYLDKHPNDPVRTMHVLYEVSQGMQYLHSRHVVHGDLKAVNVLVDEHGRASVADFGFATLKKVTSTRMTHAGGSGSVAGTLRWMSPERLSGGPLTHAVDVYAFGMTAYELVTEGDIPLTDVPDALIYQAVVNNHRRPERPSSLSETMCTKALWDLMVQCWHPDPLQRPSFAAVSIAMKNIVRDVEATAATHSTASTSSTPLVSAALDLRTPFKGDAGSANPQANNARTPNAAHSDANSLDSGVASSVATLPESTSLPGRPAFHFERAPMSGTSPLFPRSGSERSGAKDPVFMVRPSRPKEGQPGSGVGIKFVWGEPSTPNASTASESPSVANDPNFKLNFADGSWGAWVTSMTSALPVSVQTDIQRKMMTLGHNLNNGSVRGYSKSTAITEFLEELKQAAAEATTTSTDSVTAAEPTPVMNASGGAEPKLKAALERPPQENIDEAKSGSLFGWIPSLFSGRSPSLAGTPANGAPASVEATHGTGNPVLDDVKRQSRADSMLSIDSVNVSSSASNDEGTVATNEDSEAVLTRRIPNAEAREFWSLYWGSNRYEVTFSDFLSCLEEWEDGIRELEITEQGEAGSGGASERAIRPHDPPTALADRIAAVVRPVPASSTQSTISLTGASQSVLDAAMVSTVGLNRLVNYGPLKSLRSGLERIRKGAMESVTAMTRSSSNNGSLNPAFMNSVIKQEAHRAVAAVAAAGVSANAPEWTGFKGPSTMAAMIAAAETAAKVAAEAAAKAAADVGGTVEACEAAAQAAAQAAAVEAAQAAADAAANTKFMQPLGGWRPFFPGGPHFAPPPSPAVPALPSPPPPPATPPAPPAMRAMPAISAAPVSLRAVSTTEDA